MIDLHLHTTASDGQLTPAQLVDAVRRAGITTFAVTDHDTLAAVPEVRTLAAAVGLTVVSGIEITAVEAQRDVHVLGYFVDEAEPALQAFLAAQRADRRRRVEEMAVRLAELGVPVDLAPFFEAAGDHPTRAAGRPHLAAALVEAGHVADVAEAFTRFLADGRPAFVPRQGAAPEAVVAVIAGAGGVASLAHPGKLGRDDLVQRLIEAGLPAVEVFHPDHDLDARQRYLDLARRAHLLVTGGSDYHGPGTGRADALGRVTLPREAFDRLAARAGSAR